MKSHKEYLTYAHQQHKNFIDEMHVHFELANPLYVDDIQFRPLLTDGGYGSKPLIYINDFYCDPTASARFNQLNLDTTIFHESSHHLHYLKNGIFQNIWVLELIIDYSMVHYLKLKQKQAHLKNTEKYPHEKLALELHDRFASTHSLKSIVTLDETKACEFILNVLGKDHAYSQRL